MIKVHFRTAFLAFLALSLAAISQAPVAYAIDAADWRHGASIVGEPKYASGFNHFDYVNPSAPKGGELKLTGIGAFDNFNSVAQRGQLAPGIALTFDTLMTESSDEIFSQYGRLAEAIYFPSDASFVAFRLNKNARWNDGVAITTHDVEFSFNALTQYNPLYARYYADVVQVDKIDDTEIQFRFGQINNTELPLILGQLPVFPKHWWEGTDADGKPRDISATTLEIPLSSGPYRVKSFEAGSRVSYEKVPNYWGDSLPTNVGQNNFGTVAYDIFKDSNSELEAFKRHLSDFRLENTAKNWATLYDFPAARENKIERLEVPEKARGIMQGFGFNTRRDLFKDIRVREALALVLDFDDMNQRFFYNSYTRANSYFSGTDLASSLTPTGREREILNEALTNYDPVLRSNILEEHFVPSIHGDEARRRVNIKAALALLNAAGWQASEGKLINQATGQPFEFEILLVSPSFERIALHYQDSLRSLGITTDIRVVDSSQYVSRVRSRDYDMMVMSWAQSLNPGNEQRDYWGSQSADVESSRNYAGINDPVIDDLIERVIFAQTPDEKQAATRALDRVLLWNHFLVPHWYSGIQRVAYWRNLSPPPILPKFALAFPAAWYSCKTGSELDETCAATTDRHATYTLDSAGLTAFPVDNMTMANDSSSMSADQHETSDSQDNTRNIILTIIALVLVVGAIYAILRRRRT